MKYVCVILLMVAGCTSPVVNDGEPAEMDPLEWSSAFDTSATGVLSAVWGTGPEDVFAVGGLPAQGEVYHYDGTSWRSMDVPEVPLLVWVYGFGSDNVFAVGEGGGVIRYDGESWRPLSSGTTEALWGVWGASDDDVWIVGGDVGDGDPVILHFDGEVFESVDIPTNDRDATSIFKVWGIGGSVFAVGENGLILQLRGGQWGQVPAGAAADDDFVSLWGTSEDNIVAVGGRGSARIAVYDGTGWTTTLFGGTPGLNAIYMIESGEAVVGGTNGYTARFQLDSNELFADRSGTPLCVHGMWGDITGRFFAVGGRFTDPFEGVAIQLDR